MQIGVNGKCILCRQEKHLAMCRDLYFICAECEKKVAESLDAMDIAQCLKCLSVVSRLWGEKTDAGFHCLRCSNEQCGVCGEFKACPFVSEFENGWIIYCRDCRDEAKLLEMGQTDLC